MNLGLQLWGGAFFLTNKILFALAGGRNEKTKRRFLIPGWIVYILGVPPWVILLVQDRNWIAASIEAGGLPAMFFGLFNVYYRVKTPSKTFDRLAAFFTYASLVLGVSYSLWERGGITAFSQILEAGVTVGFLMGGYLLAKDNIQGWLFFMLMNCSMAALMLTQGKPILAVQQLLSLSFGVYGYVTAVRVRQRAT